MATIKNISYHTIQTDHVDEAVSLAFYLNEHGVCAQQVDDTVELPVPDVAAFEAVEMLKRTWLMFWDNSDSGLFGVPMSLPVYVKES